MSPLRGIVCLALSVALPSLGCVVAATAHGAEGDVAGSRDPPNTPRYPFARIVEYEADDRKLPRRLVTGRVDRSDRQLRIEDSIRTRGSITQVTYRLPDDTDVDDVVAHYRRELDAEVLFFCRARDCGRSNYWANDVFGVAELYGPDANQRYLAMARDGSLLAVYVIERGNKRMYAHLEVIEAEDRGALQAADPLPTLTGLGYLRVAGIEPAEDGSLPDDLQVRLEPLAEQLESLPGDRLYVVCHLQGRLSTAELVTASDRCAERAAGVFQQLLGDGIRLLPFGAGPLLPRTGVPASRLELVLPDPR